MRTGTSTALYIRNPRPHKRQRHQGALTANVTAEPRRMEGPSHPTLTQRSADDPSFTPPGRQGFARSNIDAILSCQPSSHRQILPATSARCGRPPSTQLVEEHATRIPDVGTAPSMCCPGVQCLEGVPGNGARPPALPYVQPRRDRPHMCISVVSHARDLQEDPIVFQ
jgi:hypothetical protein